MSRPDSRRADPPRADPARPDPARPDPPLPIRDVEVREDPIRLGQFLKLAGLAEHGAAAKELLEDGEVAVNGRAETRRGRQLAAGDVVAVGTERCRVRGS